MLSITRCVLSTSLGIACTFHWCYSATNPKIQSKWHLEPGMCPPPPSCGGGLAGVPRPPLPLNLSPGLAGGKAMASRMCNCCDRKCGVYFNFGEAITLYYIYWIIDVFLAAMDCQIMQCIKYQCTRHYANV